MCAEVVIFFLRERLFVCSVNTLQTMVDEGPNPAIPQDRPENNQGRNGYQATIERIMRIMGCSEEEARRIFGQRGYLAVRNIHGAAGVERLGRGHIDDRRVCMRHGCNRMQMSHNNPLCRVCFMAVRGRRG